MDFLRSVESILRWASILALIGWQAFRFEHGEAMDASAWAWIDALNQRGQPPGVTITMPSIGGVQEYYCREHPEKCIVTIPNGGGMAPLENH